jgi:UDP-glucose 4-epimerase
MMYLITGGAGYIGSRIAARLLTEGKEVRVLDSLAHCDKAAIQCLKLEFMKGDIRDERMLRKAMKDVDVVFHCAGIADPDPFLMESVNCFGTMNVLEAARKAGVRKVIYSSSSEIYGNNPKLPRTEELIPHPTTMFGVTKMQAEYYCRAFSHIHGIQTISLRYFDVYGPAHGIGLLLEDTVNRKHITVHDGEGDFVHVEDAVEANILALKPSSFGEPVNIASGRKATMQDVVNIIERLHKIDIDVTTVKSVRHHSYASIAKAKKMLGFVPKYNLEKGIKELIKYHI